MFMENPILASPHQMHFRLVCAMTDVQAPSNIRVEHLGGASIAREYQMSPACFQYRLGETLV
jgi:hypothetical protein